MQTYPLNIPKMKALLVIAFLNSNTLLKCSSNHVLYGIAKCLQFVERADRAMHLKDIALTMNVMKFVASQTISVHYNCHLPFKYMINFVIVI